MSIARTLLSLAFVAHVLPARAVLPVENWKELMELTGVKPIVIAPKSISEEEARLQHLEWMKRTWLAPELKRLEGAADFAALKPVLEYAVRVSAVQESSSIAPKFLDTVRAVFAGAERRPVTDFLCMLVLRHTPSPAPKEVAEACELVVDAPRDAVFPPLMRLISQALALTYADNHLYGISNDEQTKYYEVLTAYLQSDFDEEDARWNVYWLLDDPLSAVRWNREPRHIDLFEKSKLPEWARLNLAGATHIKWGWNASGRGWGIPKKDGYEIQAKQLVKARTKLTKSWQLKPSIPYAATDMMAVVRMSGFAEGENRRTWLDRAAAAEFDHLSAFREYVNSSRPYHTGEGAEMVAFGRACAETKRYDSELPTIFNLALHKYAGDIEDWRPVYRHPEIGKLLVETRRLRTEKLVGTASEKNSYSQLYFENWLIGDYPAAAAALEKTLIAPEVHWLGNETKDLASLVNVDQSLVMREVMLLGGPKRAEYEKTLEAFAKGNWEECVALTQPLIDAAKDETKNLLIGNSELAKFQFHYGKGGWKDGWTPMPISKWTCWSNLAGKSEWIEKTKRMRFTSTWEFSKCLFRGRLGKDFEVRGHIAHSRGASAGGLGIFNGHSPFGTGRTEAFWWSMRVDCDGQNQSRVQFAPKYDAGSDEQKSVDSKDGIAFTYRCEKGRVTFAVGDKVIIKNGRMPDDAPSGDGAFGFGILGQGSSSWAEIWGVEARMLGGNAEKKAGE